MKSSFFRISHATFCFGCGIDFDAQRLRKNKRTNRSIEQLQSNSFLVIYHYYCNYYYNPFVIKFLIDINVC